MSCGRKLAEKASSPAPSPNRGRVIALAAGRSGLEAELWRKTFPGPAIETAGTSAMAVLVTGDPPLIVRVRFSQLGTKSRVVDPFWTPSRAPLSGRAFGSAIQAKRVDVCPAA